MKPQLFNSADGFFVLGIGAGIEVASLATAPDFPLGSNASVTE
jgi:hypothetical protein